MNLTRHEQTQEGKDRNEITHTHTHTHAHAYINTHTHTHTHTDKMIRGKNLIVRFGLEEDNEIRYNVCVEFYPCIKSIIKGVC